jgi:hypothetical protein
MLAFKNLQDYVDKLKISSNSREEEEKIKEIVSRIKEHDVYTFDGKGRSLWATEIGVELIRRAIGYRIEQDEGWKNKEFSEIKNIVEYNPLIYKNKKILGFLTSGSGTTPAVVDSADLLKSILNPILSHSPAIPRREFQSAPRP